VIAWSGSEGAVRSEIVVPVIRSSDGAVVGLLEVKSERENAFPAEERALLEGCARAALPLWGNEAGATPASSAPR